MSASFGSPNWESKVKTIKYCFFEAMSRVASGKSKVYPATFCDTKADGRTAEPVTRAFRVCGILPREEMTHAISGVSVISSNIATSGKLTVSLRSKQ